MNEYLHNELTLGMAKAAGVVKLIWGVGNNAAWQVVLHALTEINCNKIDPTDPEGNRHLPPHPRYRHEVKQAFKRAIDAFHDYERQLICATQNRMFHMADNTERIRKMYGDITDRQYYEFWASIGAPAFSKTKPLITSLWNKHRLSLLNHGVSEADKVAWVLTAMAALELAGQLYEKAIRECVNVYKLPESVMRGVFGQFSMNKITELLRRALMMLAPEAEFELEPTEKRNIEMGLTQLCEAWIDPALLYDSTMESVEDYDEVFRTRGYQKKALREIAEVREETIKELKNGST
jgi:hypothetical protein